MPRYTVRPSAEADCDYWTNDAPAPLMVEDTKPINTGLIDGAGATIWRLHNPIGFGKDDEW